MRLGIFLSGCLGGEGFSSSGSRSPSRAPAVGREETRSPPILPAPSPATDKKRIYRLFSALPGNNRSQKAVFLVQLGCAGGNFAITQPLLSKNRSCLFSQIWLCCLRMYKVAGFSILRQVFPWNGGFPCLRIKEWAVYFILRQGSRNVFAPRRGKHLLAQFSRIK